MMISGLSFFLVFFVNLVASERARAIQIQEIRTETRSMTCTENQPRKYKIYDVDNNKKKNQKLLSVFFFFFFFY